MLNKIGDVDKLVNDRDINFPSAWTYANGSVAPDHIFGDLGFKSNIDLTLESNTNVKVDIDLKLDWREFKYSFPGIVKEPQYFELNGSWPKSWYIEINLKKLKLTK